MAAVRGRRGGAAGDVTADAGALRSRRGHVVRPAGAGAGAAAAGGIGPAGLRARPVLLGAGQPVRGRTGDLPLLPPAPAEPALAARVGGLRRQHARDDQGGLPPAVGDRIPRRPEDRGHRLHVRERRRRQDRHLSPRGARPRPAGEVRRRRRSRADEDRRVAARARRRDQARRLPRSGRHPPRPHGAARPARREGLRRRRGVVGDRADCRQRQAGQPGLQRHARTEARDPRRRVHRQPRGSRQRPRQGAEEQPAAGPAVAGHQPRRLQRDHVRRRRAARRGLLPQPGLRRGPRRPARSADAGRLRRRQDALRPAAHPGLRRPPLPRRHDRLRGADDRPRRGAAVDLQAEAGRLVSAGEHPGRPEQGARDLRVDRAHGVHRLPRPEAARRARGRGGRHHACRPSPRRRRPARRSSTS